MTPINRHLLCCCLLLLLAVFPAAASPVLSSESFVPNPPFVPGGQEQAVVTFAIPSGTTFPKTHSLQLQTELADPQWTIQVILDGNYAARQTVSGSAAFINGEILSYSVNHDVQFTVTIKGKVPASATGPLMVLRMVEIDNTGGVVPGSEIDIVQPVAGTTPAPSLTTVPTLTPPVITATAATTKSPGFFWVLAILGCCLAGALMRSRE